MKLNVQIVILVLTVTNFIEAQKSNVRRGKGYIVGERLQKTQFDEIESPASTQGKYQSIKKTTRPNIYSKARPNFNPEASSYVSSKTRPNDYSKARLNTYSRTRPNTHSKTRLNTYSNTRTNTYLKAHPNTYPKDRSYLSSNARPNTYLKKQSGNYPKARPKTHSNNQSKTRSKIRSKTQSKHRPKTYSKVLRTTHLQALPTTKPKAPMLKPVQKTKGKKSFTKKIEGVVPREYTPPKPSKKETSQLLVSYVQSLSHFAEFFKAFLQYTHFLPPIHIRNQEILQTIRHYIPGKIQSITNSIRHLAYKTYTKNHLRHNYKQALEEYKKWAVKRMKKRKNKSNMSHDDLLNDNNNDSQDTDNSGTLYSSYSN